MLLNIAQRTEQRPHSPHSKETSKSTAPQLTSPAVGESLFSGDREIWASLGAQPVKNQAAMQEPRFDPWVQKLLWRREGLPTPVFSPGEFHGQRRLADYSPWACKEFVTTERLRYIHTHTRYQAELNETVFCSVQISAILKGVGIRGSQLSNCSARKHCTRPPAPLPAPGATVAGSHSSEAC